MAMLQRDSAAPAKPCPPPLARVMREFEQLVRDFERSLHRSLAHAHAPDVHREACRLAISDLSDRYARKHIRRALHAAEAEGKRVEDQLHAQPAADALAIHHGYFRLHSTELFDTLGQPTDLRFGTLRFHHDHDHENQHHDNSINNNNEIQNNQNNTNNHNNHLEHTTSTTTTVELALNSSFFVAHSHETLPYHTFRMPTAPSLQNRGMRCRNPDEDFPAFDSWLLFTFLGNGCIKLEVPVEMCAHVYGGPLRGRENEELTFWGFFVDDDDP